MDQVQAKSRSASCSSAIISVTGSVSEPPIPVQSLSLNMPVACNATSSGQSVPSALPLVPEARRTGATLQSAMIIRRGPAFGGLYSSGCTRTR